MEPRVLSFSRFSSLLLETRTECVCAFFRVCLKMDMRVNTFCQVQHVSGVVERERKTVGTHSGVKLFSRMGAR